MKEFARNISTYLINYSQAKKGALLFSVLDQIENSVYRRRTLKRGFHSALFLAEMVNAVVSKFGGFCVYG